MNGYSTDILFAKIKETVTSRTEEELVSLICACYNNWAQKTPQEAVVRVVEFHKRFHFWGMFDPGTGNIEMIQQRARILTTRWDEIESLYHRLADYRSKKVLTAVLDNWITFSYKGLDGAMEHCFKPYFDLDLIQCDENEVFVDLGAYIGDTVEDYIYSYGEANYKRIYTYEMEPDNIKTLHQKFDGNPKIVIRPVGVCDRKGQMFLAGNGTVDAQFLTESGEIPVETVALDEDIKEPITLLKTDIEGAEMAALKGARRHITEDKPKLAISIYHSNSDLLDIIKRIDEYQPGYTFYLRLNRAYDPVFPADYMLVGIYENK